MSDFHQNLPVFSAFSLFFHGISMVNRAIGRRPDRPPQSRHRMRPGLSQLEVYGRYYYPLVMTNIAIENGHL